MASGKFVVTSNRFDSFDRALTRAIEQGLKEGAKTGEGAAERAPQKGYRISGIVGDVQITSVTAGRRGLEISIIWRDFRSRFFEKGTYASRRGKLAKPRKSESSNRGVKPIRFMLAARKAGAEVLLERIHDKVDFR